MATKPTESRGIFYEGFKKGAREGRSAPERSPQTVSAPAGNTESALGRMLYPASKPNTAESMRKPFG